MFAFPGDRAGGRDSKPCRNIGCGWLSWNIADRNSVLLNCISDTSSRECQGYCSQVQPKLEKQWHMGMSAYSRGNQCCKITSHP